MFEDMVSPVIAAQNLLTMACTKRKAVLDPVLAFCISILQQPPEQRDYRKKDGALHILGSVYEALMKKVFVMLRISFSRPFFRDVCCIAATVHQICACVASLT